MQVPDGRPKGVPNQLWERSPGRLGRPPPGLEVVDAPDPAVLDGEHHEDLAVQERDVPKPRPGDTHDHPLCLRMQFEAVDTALTLVERGPHPLQHGLAPMAHELRPDALMDDLRIETGGERIGIAPPSGVEVVENDLHRLVAHRLLLWWRRLAWRRLVSGAVTNASEQKGPTVHHGVR